ncbi:CBS domain-containing protein [Nonomuraea turkmeniaca]|uniref:CBS domain-containing protein n=1 Tax=Nonomuraea turkmeniaca TaxID=103838 RepID=A0A5S4FCH3_9ACTN|nr:CBS domain-containing protein [Nonomuraea turkmeniaca]TMR15669.1 CBS domain-containing protein [Nonomuraea turkmeniaca]
MIARDLAHDFPAVRSDARLMDVLAAIVRRSLPGVVILDSSGRPQATLSLPEALDLLLPWPFRESPTLAGVFPEEIGDRILTEAIQRPISDFLPTLPLVGHCCGRSTALEVVVAMARQRSPLATVFDARAGSNVICAHRLLARLLQSRSEGSMGQEVGCRS